MSLHPSITDALQRGDAAQALHLARKAVAADAGDAQAYGLLAMALAARGETAQAHASLDRAMALAPDDPILHVQRAALMLEEDRPDDVKRTLQRSVELDPNTLPAYLMQAQIALRGGELGEAARLCRIAARIDASHPALLTMQGLVALQDGHPEQGLRLISRAAEQRPEHPPTLHALAMAYLANDHVAFAEQALRRLLALRGDDMRIRRVLAHLIARQGRPGEAADVLEDGQALPEAAVEHALTVAALRQAAGQATQARTVLEHALEAHPHDARLVQLWLQSLQALPEASLRSEAVDARLQQHPDHPQLWSARLQLAMDADEAGHVVERWKQALPDSVSALFAEMQLAQATQQPERAVELASTIVQRDSLHLPAHALLFQDHLQRSPEAAIAHVQALLAQELPPLLRSLLHGWLGHACDRADRPVDAVAAWVASHPSAETGGIALPQATDRNTSDPPPGTGDPTMPANGPTFLFGLPGSGVERIADLLARNTPILRADRMQPPGVDDPLRSPAIAGDLPGHAERARALVDGWRAQLPQRGVSGTAVIDWLAWWDNALLHALRPHLPQGRLLLVLRDPRRMLLDWLAGSSHLPYRFGQPEAAAQWLAEQLAHAADLLEHDLYPALRFDPDHAGLEDPHALATALGRALGAPLQASPQPWPPRLPATRWQAYREVLGPAFARLHPVAERLGYASD